MSLLEPFRPIKPYTGPVRLGIYYCLPLLKSERKAIREQGWTTHDRKPDADNLCKMFQDCMGKLLFWEDDARVVHLSFRKYRSEKPGIGVALEHCSDEQVGDPREFM